MANKAYEIGTPEELMALYAIQQRGNRKMESLARVWRALRNTAKRNVTPPLTDVARIAFDSEAPRKARIIKRIGGYSEEIGVLSYNKALAYCRDHLNKVEDQA